MSFFGVAPVLPCSSFLRVSSLSTCCSICKWKGFSVYDFSSQYLHLLDALTRSMRASFSCWIKFGGFGSAVDICRIAVIADGARRRHDGDPSQARILILFLRHRDAHRPANRAWENISYLFSYFPTYCSWSWTHWNFIEVNWVNESELIWPFSQELDSRELATPMHQPIWRLCRMVVLIRNVKLKKLKERKRNRCFSGSWCHIGPLLLWSMRMGYGNSK